MLVGKINIDKKPAKRLHMDN